jgi:hypothetical protein
MDTVSLALPGFGAGGAAMIHDSGGAGRHPILSLVVLPLAVLERDASAV